MRKQILLIIALLPVFCLAQDHSADYVDVVVMHSGSKFIGHILAIDAEDNLKFKLITGAEMKIHKPDIKYIYQRKTGKGTKPYRFRDQGFYVAAELEIIGGDERTDDAPGIGIQAAAGYRIKRWLGTGLAFGYHNFYLGSNEKLYTLAAEARGFLNEHNVSPYYGLQLGYGWVEDSQMNGLVSSSGNFFWSPQIGLRFGGGAYGNFYAGVSYLFQKASFTYNTSRWRQESIEQRVSYRRLNIKLGILF